MKTVCVCVCVCVRACVRACVCVLVTINLCLRRVLCIRRHVRNINTLNIICILYQPFYSGNYEKGISVVRPPISSYGAGPDICGLTCLLCEHRASDFPLRLSFRRGRWTSDSCRKVGFFVGFTELLFMSFLMYLG